MSINRKGFLVSKQLVQAIAKIEGENIFGRLEPGQILTQELLARTLMQIANIDKIGKLSKFFKKSAIIDLEFFFFVFTNPKN